MLSTAYGQITRINRRTVTLAAAAMLALPLAIGAALPAAASPAPARAHRAAPAANTWQPTAGAMSVARSGHTATTLHSGMVLIVGGSSAAADLYNPATGTFTPTGSMSVARPGASATLLPDGQVLVAGGCCTGSDNLSSAELYNPASGTWSPTGSMVHGRSGQTATLLPDGQVLVAGGACNGTAYGCDSGSSLVNQNSAELYNPATGKWTATGSMLDGREFATATLLPNGQVLVAGGFNNCDDSFCTDLAEAELYSPATGTWARTGSFKGPREQHTATLLPDGQVLVAGGLNQGGFGNGGVDASAELYNPSTGTWTQEASMTTARYGQTATLLRNGWVLIAGGHTAGAELYEPTHNLWVSPGAMSTVRTAATATLLADGHVLVTGGSGPNGSAQPTAEVFLAGPGPLVRVSPASLSFSSQLVGSAGAAQSFTVANDGNRALNVSGISISGTDPSDFTASGNCTAAPLAPGATCTISARFAPTATGLRTAQVGVADNAPLSPHGVAAAGYGSGPNVFAPTGPLGISRNLATGTLLPDGNVLIAGGQQGASANPLAESELYNPATRSFTPTGSMNTGRAWATATLLPDGNVLVAGGKGANSANLASAELYRPSTGTWTVTASMNASGYALNSTLLPNGKVLVTGLGFGASAEVYDPATGTWADTGPVVTAQDFATATLLNTGQVLLAGGDGTAAELYNPATNGWTATGSMNVARQYPTATRLPNGQVLVAGGDPPGGGTSLASAELYNPSTGKWTLTGAMISGRYGASATLLNTGAVLIAGGCTGSCGPTLKTTELYSGGFFTEGPAMTEARLDATAVLLADGDLLIAAGGTQYCCGVTDTADLLTLPAAIVSPTSGPAGQAITVTGRGFYAGETVQVTLDFGTPLGKTTSTSAGTFVLHTKIPAGTSAGVHGLQAFGQSSFATGTTTFKVT